VTNFDINFTVFTPFSSLTGAVDESDRKLFFALNRFESNPSLVQSVAIFHKQGYYSTLKFIAVTIITQKLVQLKIGIGQRKDF